MRRGGLTTHFTGSRPNTPAAASIAGRDHFWRLPEWALQFFHFDFIMRLFRELRRRQFCDAPALPLCGTTSSRDTPLCPQKNLDTELKSTNNHFSAVSSKPVIKGEMKKKCWGSL